MPELNTLVNIGLGIEFRLPTPDSMTMGDFLLRNVMYIHVAGLWLLSPSLQWVKEFHLFLHIILYMYCVSINLYFLIIQRQLT